MPTGGATGAPGDGVPFDLRDGLAILEANAMAIGRAGREALLDATLATLCDRVGFAVAWGVCDLAGGQYSGIRCRTGSALRDRPVAECAPAIEPVLDELRAAAGDNSRASLRLVATSRAAPAAAGALLRAFALDTLLVVPLLSRQLHRVTGLLAVGSRESALGAPEVMQLAEALGGQLGAAISYGDAIEQLRVSEELSHLLTENAGDGLYMLDPAGNYTYVNPQLERTSGYSKEELLGRHFTLLMPAEQWPIAHEMPRRAAAGEPVPEHYEIELRMKDGALRPFEINSRNIYGEHDGQLVGRFGIARDITERRRLEEELARRNRAVEALNAIATLAGRSIDLGAVLDAALDRTLAVFGIDRGAIYLLDKEEGDLALAVQRGFGAALVASLGRLPADHDIPARVLAADADALAELIRAEGIGAYACVALRSQEQTLGLLAVAAGDGRALSPADVDTLGIVGAQLGAAIENARLAAESAAQRASLEAKTAQLSRLLDVSAGFAANRTLDELLNTVASAIVDTLGFGSAHVRVRDDHRGDALIGVGFQGHSPEQIAALRGPTPLVFYERLLDPRFQIGGVYYIPHGVDRQVAFGDDWTVVRRPVQEWRPGRWHPEDALVVPLHARDGALLGVIYVDEPAEGRLPDVERLAVLELFGRQAALAIENANLYEEAHDQTARLETLREAIERISSELDLPALLNRLVVSAVTLLDADRGTIALVEAGDGSARIEAGYNLPDGLLGQRLAPGEGLTGMALARRGPVLIGPEDPQPAPPPIIRALGMTMGQAHIAVPIWWQDRLIGTFSLSSTRPDKRFTPADLGTLATLARHAAVAIENARLHAQGRILAVTEERNRMAREIHDGLAQGFTGVILQLQVAESLLTGEEPEARARISRAQTLARASLQEARRSVWNLRPNSLQGGSLPDAIRAHLDDWRAQTGLTAAFTLDGDPRPLAAETEEAVLRVAQEALNNAYKHARAGQVTLTLAIAPDSVCLRVCDDGVGFAGPPEHTDGSGFGLISMRERIARLGGDFDIESTPGQGTCVRIVVRDTEAAGGGRRAAVEER